MDASRRGLLFGGAALTLTPPRGGFGRRGGPRLPDMDAAVRGAFDLTAFPALSVAVAKPGGVVWKKAYGHADLELSVAASPDHRFRLGSVAKAVTASLAARLAMKQTVDPGAPIETYLSGLPAHHVGTTLEQLLRHQGGVRHYTGSDFDPSQPGGMIDLRSYPDMASALRLFIDDPLVASPGTSTRYSTFGYTLASAVMEAAAGKPFLRLIADEVAGPLGLGSLAGDNPYAIERGRITGYEPVSRFERASPGLEGPFANALTANPAYKWAGGGLISDMEDIARFGLAHLTPGHWNEAALRLLFTPVPDPGGSGSVLGLGWRVDRDGRGRLRWHHAGTQAGCRASLVVYPAEQLSIAFATNLTGIPGDVLAPTEALADAAAI